MAVAGISCRLLEEALSKSADEEADPGTNQSRAISRASARTDSVDSVLPRSNAEERPGLSAAWRCDSNGDEHEDDRMPGDRALPVSLDVGRAR